MRWLHEVVRRRLGELDERLREMRRYRNELVTALAKWEERGDAPGHVCGLIEGADLRGGAGGETSLKRRGRCVRRPKLWRVTRSAAWTFIRRKPPGGASTACRRLKSP